MIQADELQHMIMIVMMVLVVIFAFVTNVDVIVRYNSNDHSFVISDGN